MSLVHSPADIVERAEASGDPGLLGRDPAWPRIHLSQLVRIQNGAAFKSRFFNTAGDGLPLIRIRDVGRDASTTWYSGDFAPDFVVRSGDLLVGMDGDFRAAVWHGSDGLLNQRVSRLTVMDHRLDVRWLQHVLQGYLDAIWAETSSITVKHLSSRTIGQIPIPLPPVSQQRRIVDALEDHLSRLDAGEANLRASGKKAAALRSRAVEATLETSFGHDQGAARQRLGRIVELRETLVRQRRKVATPPAYQLDLPDGWVTASVDQLCYQIQYGTSTKASPANRGADVAVLRMGNIQDGEIDVGSLKYISADDPSIGDLLLEPGDLLFNRTNSAELVGKTAVFTDQLQCATFASYLIRCRTVPGVSAQWISYIANSSIGRRYIESVMSQQVGQANVNGTKLAAMPVPITGADAEGILVEEISELRRSSARFANEVSDGLTRSRALRRSLLRAAFNGELVDQDPSDEPAEAALERLRAAQKPVRKRAGKSSAAVAAQS